MDNDTNSKNFITKFAELVVDKRNVIFLFLIIGTVFSLFSSSWVKVENDLKAYLPDSSETKMAIDIMNDEFVTFGSAEFMIANIQYDEAENIAEEIKDIEGVRDVTFDRTSYHYHESSALYSIVFDYDEKNDKCLEVLETVESNYQNYDTYTVTSLGNQQSEIIDAEVSVIMVYVAIIVVVVLLLVSDTIAEVPVLLLTFLSAMILNSGTNFVFGEISFVSDSVTSILQLALSLDYAIILSNRFKEENKKYELREAVIVALGKAIPEISSSSLTTIGGLVAMMFMQLKIGPDMAICLIKAILFSLFSVFTIMPGLLVLFGPLMKKTQHKSLVPKISFVGKFAYWSRKIVFPIFIVIILICSHLSSDCPYAYGYGLIETPKLNETQIAENIVKDTFDTKNYVAVVVPKGDYDKERQLLDRLESCDEVDSTMGLVNLEAMDGYMLADELTPRQFAELADLDVEIAQLIYAAYAAENENYGTIINNITTYKVELMNIFLFVTDQLDDGAISLDQEQTEMLEYAEKQMEFAKLQLSGENYSRMLIYLNLPESGDETYEFIDYIKEIALDIYGDDVYVVGDSTSDYDFKKTFSTDNIVITLVSILIVLIVLLFTFKSVGMPILLIMVIQGSIWINFTIPALTGLPIFFMSYLVVSSIQMGANIDYAIVIASRFNELKNEMPHKDAIIETMNFAFPTIITSGSILAIAGFLIGKMTSEPAIVGIGQSIGRGTIISIFLVLFVLPQILLVGNKFADKTTFETPKKAIKKQNKGTIHIDGYVNGEINGKIIGNVNAIVSGDANLNVLNGKVKEEKNEKI